MKKNNKKIYLNKGVLDHVRRKVIIDKYSYAYAFIRLGN